MMDIGRDGPIRWSPKAPDVTLLDLFLWGYVKDNVCKSRFNDVKDLKTRIVSVVK